MLRSVTSIAALSCLLLFSGCLDPAAQKTALIKDMVKGGMSVKSKVMSNSGGTFKDYKVYRDGTKDGVVFEYIYAPGVEVDRTKLSDSIIKSKMKSEFAKDANSKKVMNMGIYVRFIYKSSEGTVYADTKITKDDL